MVAESLVENNPKVFGNRLYEDLTDRERMEVYGAGLEEASTNFAKQLKMKKKTFPYNAVGKAQAAEFAKTMGGKKVDNPGYGMEKKMGSSY